LRAAAARFAESAPISARMGLIRSANGLIGLRVAGRARTRAHVPISRPAMLRLARRQVRLSQRVRS
jgi:hypothetical protein